MTDVLFSGVGVLSGAGRGIAPLWQALVEEKSLIKNGVSRIPLTGAPIEFAITAATDALSHAGWSGLNDDDGLILATTVGQTPLWESEVGNFLLGKSDVATLSHSLRKQPLGDLLSSLSERLHFRGRRLLISSACSASTQALGLASEWICQKRVKRCLVGGVEVLSRLTVEGFRSLQLLSPTPARPFDAERTGINLSEASVFMCLESSPSRPLARLRGWGMSTDAYHATSPHPEGAGSYRAMKAALERADLNPSDISWVHAHGTGSQANDQAEGTAIATLLETPVSSTKAVHGHSLGASGILETAICVEALQRRFILRTPGLIQPDSRILVKHVEHSQPFQLRHILKNTLGFGGNNAALVISGASQ